MLIELYQLARNLPVPPEPVHKDLDVPGLGGFTNLKVLLNEEGEIVRLESLNDQDSPGLWTLKRYNFKFFPAVRPSNPPIRLDLDDPFWDSQNNPSAQELLRSLDTQLGRLRDVDLSAVRDEQALRILKWHYPEEPSELATLQTFAQAFIRFAQNPSAVARSLVDSSRRELVCADQELVRGLFALLLGKRQKPKNRPPSVEYRVQLLFDVALSSKTIYHPRMKRLVAECLIASDATETTGSSDPGEGICAFEQIVTTLLAEPFPEWRAVKGITKNVAPFAKFSEATCNYRYGKADSDGFSIGTNTARRLVAAIRWLTSEQMFGKTWRSIRNGKLERKQGRIVEREDVLIAYPSFAPRDLALVRLFSSEYAEESESDDDDSLHDFASAAQPVLTALREKVEPDRIKQWVLLLLIRQVSKGQAQVAFSATPTINEFTSAVEAWKASEANLPPGLRVPLPSKAAKVGIGWFSPRLLFPEEVCRLLTHHWIRDGTESSRVEAPPVGMVFDLFLRKPGVWQDHAEILLETTLSRGTALLTSAGQMLHKDGRGSPEKWSDFVPKTSSGRPDKNKADPRYCFANTLSLIGSLLYAMNSTADEYMNQSAFLVGKLLAMMDELHRCYCIAVREGDIPNALIGNGLLGRAAESPASAIAELQDRGRIYLGWAKTASAGERSTEHIRIAVNSARKVLRLAGPLADRLNEATDLEGELTSTRKAHLFLGYLSPVLGKVPDPTAEIPDDDTGNQTGQGFQTSERTQP